MKTLTTKEVAAILGISLRQVQTLIKTGKLPARKMGRDYIINESDLKQVRHRPKGRPPMATLGLKNRPDKTALPGKKLSSKRQ